MSQVLLLLANGTEELEAVTIIDILRRASIDVTVASLDGEVICGSQNTKIAPDTSLDAVLHENFDMMVLPGGLPGADNLEGDARVQQLLKRMAAEGKFVTAICAAPGILGRAGLLDGKRATCYPGFLDTVEGISSTGAAVEHDGTVITSRGPGTAMDFALTLIEALDGVEQRGTVEQALVRS